MIEAFKQAIIPKQSFEAESKYVKILSVKYAFP